MKQNQILGITNPDKLLRDMWNGMSNSNQINLRVVNNSDVLQRSVNGKCIILIKIPEVKLQQKPVYLKGKLDNTYIRTGEGDRKATADEIAAMLRNTVNNADSQFLEGYGLSDLDSGSLNRLKILIISRFPGRDLQDLSDEDFLIRIGAAVRDRITGKFSLYYGTLLMIGKTNVIKEVFPHFHLDYYEYLKNSDRRWDYRISDDDYLQEEINLLTFYEKVMARIQAKVMDPFYLDDDMVRQPDRSIHTSIREALVNSLVHADYLMSDASVRIESREDYYLFRNPGQLLIKKEEFFTGGISKPRNEILMKLFRMLGFAERQGFGGSQIYINAEKRELRLPEIQTDLEATELKLWMTPARLNDSVQSENEKNVLVIFWNHPDDSLSFSEILSSGKLTEHHLRKTLKILLDKKQIRKIGRGRGVKYELTN